MDTGILKYSSCKINDRCFFLYFSVYIYIYMCVCIYIYIYVCVYISSEKQKSGIEETLFVLT